MNSRTIAHFIRLQPSILHYVELGRQCGKAGEETVGDRDASVAAKRTRYSSFLTSVANAEAACSPYPPSCDTWFSKRDPRLADTSTTRTHRSCMGWPRAGACRFEWGPTAQPRREQTAARRAPGSFPR